MTRSHGPEAAVYFRPRPDPEAGLGNMVKRGSGLRLVGIMGAFAERDLGFGPGYRARALWPG